MKIIIADKDIKEDSLLDLRTNDKSSIKITGQGPTKNNGRGPEIPELTKELAALDKLSLTGKEVAEIHGITPQSVNGYGRGENISDETKVIVESTKNQISNKAVGALMATLDLFNPRGLEDQMEIVGAASKLAGIVEKLGPKEKRENDNVHIHLYAPRMKKIEDYGDVIDV